MWVKDCALHVRTTCVWSDWRRHFIWSIWLQHLKARNATGTHHHFENSSVQRHVCICCKQVTVFLCFPFGASSGGASHELGMLKSGCHWPTNTLLMNDISPVCKWCWLSRMMRWASLVARWRSLCGFLNPALPYSDRPVNLIRVKCTTNKQFKCKLLSVLWPDWVLKHANSWNLR